MGGLWFSRQARRFFALLYASGDVENYAIDNINFQRLVHISVMQQSERVVPALQSAGSTSKGVVVLAHGFSEEDGPNYALIRTLENLARRQGWRVAVPDFRPNYRYPRDPVQNVCACCTKSCCASIHVLQWWR